jgi:hypothetical protein
MKQLTPEILNEFKEDQLRLITKVMTDEGQLPPLGAVLLHDKVTDKLEVGFIPVPGQFLQSDEAKEALATKLFPTVFDSMESDGFKEILVFSWITEVWLRETRTPSVPQDWKDIPKTEGVMIHIETKDNSQTVIKLVKRDGNVVNRDGKLIENVILEDHPGFAGTVDGQTGSTEGRFSRVLRNYLKSK